MVVIPHIQTILCRRSLALPSCPVLSVVKKDTLSVLTVSLTLLTNRQVTELYHQTVLFLQHKSAVILSRHSGEVSVTLLAIMVSVY